MDALQPYLSANAKIPSTSACPLPEAIVRLETEPGKTTYRRQYPIALSIQPKVQEQVDKWLADGVIEIAPPNTAFNSPLLTVRKKDANDRTDRFQLPLIAELHQKMSAATLFTVLDLKQAFHRLPLAEEHRALTAFTFNGQQYQFCRAPFGLTPIPNHFQRVLTTLLHDLPYVTCFIDDLTIGTGPDIEEHIKCVTTVIERLTSAKFILNVDKCHFMQTSQKGCKCFSMANTKNWKRYTTLSRPR
ncbi:hypothetical protein G6F38_013472 [Rhizopus arrhizus]|nr:hypothetical protein G6F38_013472 [Rhizopus arrhizus]